MPSVGILPMVENNDWEAESVTSLAREFDGWTNHPSARKGFCAIVRSEKEAEELRPTPVLNTCGLIVTKK